MNKQLILKIVGVVVPVLVAVAGLVYGDITPVIRDVCDAVLPSNVVVKEVDGGASR